MTSVNETIYKYCILKNEGEWHIKLHQTNRTQNSKIMIFFFKLRFFFFYSGGGGVWWVFFLTLKIIFEIQSYTQEHPK